MQQDQWRAGARNACAFHENAARIFHALSVARRAAASRVTQSDLGYQSFSITLKGCTRLLWALKFCASRQLKSGKIPASTFLASTLQALRWPM
jgi:hypothetical protein